MKNLTIIIPMYNEEDSVKKTISSIKETLSNCDIQYEIICVNDGSTDNTKNILNEIKNITAIHHKKNKGYGSSLKTGLRKAKYPSICITDADGTYPNEDIPKMYNYFIENSLDMLVGSRTGDNVVYPFIKKIPKYFIKKFASYISNHKIVDINSGLRIFNKEIAFKYFHLFPQGFSFTTTITMGMLCDEYEVDYIPINYYKRAGKSKIHPWKDTIGFFQLLIRIALYFRPFKFFNPIIIFFFILSIMFFIKDVIIQHNLSDSSIFFPIMTILFFTMALLADLIIKRSTK